MITFRDKNHKFGGSIQGVRGTLDLLEEEIKELPDQYRVKLQKIQDVLLRGITRVEVQAEELKAISYRFIKPNLDLEDIIRQMKEENANKKILVVEDDEIMIEVMPAFLKKRGFQVTLVSNIEAAKTVIQNEKPFVIILDLALGESLGGIEILRWIREKNITSRCIVQTKMDNKDILKEVEELRPDKLLLKPYSLSTLEAQINALMINTEA
jgi:CheY-like chemotaxis protein